jgi:hypothetical protein
MRGKLMIISASILSASLIGWPLLNEAQKDSLIGVATFSTDERKCFNIHVDDYRDPSSAYIASSYVWTKELEEKYPTGIGKTFDEYDAVIRVKVHAKNGFGAYSKNYIECPLVDGKLNDREARRWRLKSKF